MKADLVHRLRSRSYSFKIPDPLVEEAADEIERLRLTDAERAAIEVACEDLRHAEEVAIMRGLLARHGATGSE